MSARPPASRAASSAAESCRGQAAYIEELSQRRESVPGLVLFQWFANLEIPEERESFISGRDGQGGGNMQHSQPPFLHLQAMF